MTKLIRCSLLVLAMSIAAPAENPRLWVVVAITGHWHIEGNPQQELHFGQGLKPNTRVVLKDAANRAGTLSIALDEKTKISRACEDPGDCKDAVVVPGSKGQAQQPASSESPVLKALQALLENPKRYVSAVSRDFGSVHDAVACLNGKSADLTPVFKGLGKDSYYIRVERLDHKTDKVFTATPVLIPWSPDSAGSARVPGFTPGLYRLQLSNQRGEATGGDAWVLVADAGKYEQASKEFERAAAALAAWKEDVPNASLRAILRARLDELAR